MPSAAVLTKLSMPAQEERGDLKKQATIYSLLQLLALLVSKQVIPRLPRDTSSCKSSRLLEKSWKGSCHTLQEGALVLSEGGQIRNCLNFLQVKFP